MANKLIALLGAAGLTAGLGLAAPDDASALGKGFENASPEALEAMLQQNPAGSLAGDAFQVLASRFKDPGDKGRPDSFGPPGQPDIGAPGQYSG